MRSLFLLLLAGCDVIYGLERPSDGATSGDAQELRVEVEIGVTEIVQKADGQLESRFVPIESLPRVTLDDGTAPAVTSTATGFEFSRARADQEYRFSYVLARSELTTLVATKARARVVQPILGRFDRDEVDPDTRVTATVVTASPRTAWAVSTGLRTRRVINEPPNQLSSFTYDWSQVMSQSGPSGLPSAMLGDRLHLIEYDLAAGWYQIATIRSGALTLEQGQTSSVDLTLGPALPEVCAQINARRARDFQRLATAAGGIDFPDSKWIVSATPDPVQTTAGGMPLAYENTSPMVDLPRMVHFWNPFAREKLVVEMSTTATTMRGPTPVGVSATTVVLVPETALSCGGLVTSVVIEGTTGFASDFTIDGAPITDPLPMPRGEIAWSVTDGDADEFVVRIQEAGAPLGPPFVTHEPALRVDPGTFVAGRRYYIHVTVLSGRPGVATGDFSSHAFPTGSTGNASAAFVVQ